MNLCQRMHQCHFHLCNLVLVRLCGGCFAPENQSGPFSMATDEGSVPYSTVYILKALRKIGFHKHELKLCF